MIHVGGAAMTLPRYVAATRPTSAQIVLEPDTELTAFVRHHLPLLPAAGSSARHRRPPRHRSTARRIRRPGDHRRLRGRPGTGRPDDCGVLRRCSARSFRSWSDHHQPHRSRTALLRAAGVGGHLAFPHVLLCAEPSTLKGRRFGNVIIAGGATPLPYASIADRAGRPPFPYRVLHGARLRQLLADSAPFSDDDAEQSPEPGPACCMR